LGKSGHLMSISSVGRSKWARTKTLCKYLGVSAMTIWRWRRDPALNFPKPTEINGISYTDLDAVDEWMKQRVVEHHSGDKRK
jgi:predicted DNA-binding transcriptional regulator AlpA